jgi:Zn-dependent metalloprotease
MRCLLLTFLALFAGCSRNQPLASRTLAQADRDKLQIRFNQKLSTPEWISGTLTRVQAVNRVDSVLRFMAANPEIFKLRDPAKELVLQKQSTDEMGFEHLRFSRLHNAMPIWNDDLILHINKKGDLYLVNGNYHASQMVPSYASIGADKAAEIALAAGKEKKMDQVKENVSVWYPVNGSLRPAFHLVLSNGMNSWDFFVAADNGEILFHQDRRRF